MKFNYKFKNSIGCVYTGGPIQFSGDSSTLRTPVGNRISHLDLRHCSTHSIDDVTPCTVVAVDTSPDEFITVAADEQGVASVVSNVNQSVIRRHDFRGPVSHIKFSPCGELLALVRHDAVCIYHAPGAVATYNPFCLHKLIPGILGQVTSLDWSADSKLLLLGCDDSVLKVCAARFLRRFHSFTVPGHHKPVVGAHFIDDSSADFYSVSTNGVVLHYTCTRKLSDFVQYTRKRLRLEEQEDTPPQEEQEEEDPPEDPKFLAFVKRAKHFINELQTEHVREVTASDYHKRTRMLVVGSSDGTFSIFEMPDLVMVQSVNMSAGKEISAVSVSPAGDWIGVACEALGQAIVWEWQSETYIMKQQSHASDHKVSTVAFSPDEQFLATGSSDCKLKLWHFSSGFCFLTFCEHSAGITEVTFDKSGKVVLSASLDGTVRAFDMKRYRNFRTLTSPHSAQFSCLSVDDAGDMVGAGTQDVFDVFVWSLKTGRLLEMLSGHSSSVTAVQFSPVTSLLVSTSLDRSIRVWDVVLSSKGATEPIDLNSDIVALAVSPTGKEIAVSTLKAQITIIDHVNNQMKDILDVRQDLGVGRGDDDAVTARTLSAGRTFTCLCYSADGDFLIAGGRSKFVCVYSLVHKVLFRKFAISKNYSLSRMSEFLDRRKMTDFGNKNLIDDNTETALPLPGVKNKDLGERSFRPEVRVDQAVFSPTGRSWAAATTEGVVIYSLDDAGRFDPYMLARDVTPDSVRSLLKGGDFQTSLIHSLKLGEPVLTRQVMESTPVCDITTVVCFLPTPYVLKLVKFLVAELGSSHHIEFYLLWSKAILLNHRTVVRDLMPKSDLNAFNKVLVCRYESLRQICDPAKYAMQYVSTVCEMKKLVTSQEGGSDAESDDSISDVEAMQI